MSNKRYYAEKLIREGYDEETVIKAIEVLQVDWKSQTLRSVNYPPEGVIYEMTTEDLTERLKREGFKDENIIYSAERRKMQMVDGHLIFYGDEDWWKDK